MIDLRTPLVILLTVVLCTFTLGYDFPIRLGSMDTALIDLTLYVGSVILLRTLLRLPFVVVITRRRTRYAMQTYGMSRREALMDGYLRGVADRRRWTVGMLAQVDRFALLVMAYLTTVPGLGRVLVQLGGLFGLLMLILIYLITGKFALLLSDDLDGRSQNRTVNPIIDTRR